MNISKEKLPLVSLAIITYNQKEYLRECIESVLAQDYPNIEIVIADDCSNDGTQDMVGEYDKNYPGRFVLRLAEKNIGITGNSNVALFACGGKYIAIIGGDDLCLPGKITKQVQLLENNPGISLCGTYTKLINSKGEMIGVSKDFKKKNNPLYTHCELIASGNGLVPVVSYMFRYSSIPSDGFDIRLPIASDGLFMRHVARVGGIYIIKEVLTAYRQHESHAKKLGYMSDSILTQAFNEYYFPECYKEIMKMKSIYWRRIGVQSIISEDKEKAILYLKMSEAYKFNLYTFFLIFLTRIGLSEKILKILISFR